MEMLCKRVPFPSLLRTASPNSLVHFRWSDVMDELGTKAPTLLSVLEAAASSKGQKCTQPAVVMAAAILLKSRSLQMCKLQAIVGCLLYSGHASKRV